MDCVREKIENGNYHSVTIISDKFTLLLRPPKLPKNKGYEKRISKMPEWCEDIGLYPVKAVELKEEGEITFYV